MSPDANSPSAEGSREKRDSLLALSLRTYLQQNRARYPSMTAFAKAVGLSRHTIMQICDGSLTRITGQTRSAIYAASGLSSFAPFAEHEGRPTRSLAAGLPSVQPSLSTLRRSAEAILSAVSELELAEARDVGIPKRAPAEITASQRVERVRQVLTSLDQELTFYKDVSREREREMLRSRIDARDIGYIIAVLRALYSKEAFDNWVLASGYDIRKGEG